MSTYNSPTDIQGAVKVRTSHINNLDAAVAAGFALLPSEDALRLGTVQYAADTESLVNAYVVSMPQLPSSYIDGMLVVFKPSNTNTGASTINIDGLGITSIVQYNGAALAAGDLTQGVPTAIIYSISTSKFHRVGSGPAGATGATGATGSLANFANGSEGAPSIASSTEPSTGFGLEGAGKLFASVQGFYALRLQTSITGLGWKALRANTGTCNVGIGALSLAATLGGSFNTAVGFNSAAASTVGEQMCAFGSSALAGSTGSYNTAIGYQALAGNTSGISNVAVGWGAGGASGGNENTTGSNNTWVGVGCGPGVASASSLQNSSAFGYGALSLINNQVVLGNASVTSIVGGANATQTLGTAAKSWKGIYFDYTITATIGTVTINKPAGNAIIGAGNTTVLVNNNLVNANSIIMVTPKKPAGGVALYAPNVTPAAGSFTIAVQSSYGFDIEYYWFIASIN